MDEENPGTGLRAALRDDVFPALAGAAGPQGQPAALRALLRLLAGQMAAARGLTLPEGALGGADGLPAGALAVASQRLAALDAGSADVRLPGLLLADLAADPRASGRYYTPPEVARLVAEWTVGPLPAGPSIRIIDPAMGSGHFLLAAGEVAAAGLHTGSPEMPLAESRWRAAGCLWGIERDPLAAELARLTLWLWACEAGRAGSPGDLWHDLQARLTCADALLADAPGDFDAVVGNPPYASVFTRAQANDGQREALQTRYVTASGSYDLAVPFVERAVGLCRIGGRVGLVLPNKLLAADYARTLRGWLGERVSIEAMVDYSAAQPFTASVYPVALVLRVEPPQPEGELAVYRADGRGDAPRCIRRGRQADLRGAPGEVWSGALDPAWEALRACFEGTIPLGEVAALTAGLTVAEAYALLPRVVDAPPGVKPGRAGLPDSLRGELHALPPDAVRLVTSGLIDRHRSRWGTVAARYLKRCYQRPVVMLDALPPRRREQALTRKIVVAGLGLRPRAFLDHGHAQASVATTVVIPQGWPPGALCAVLNSALVARLYRALFGGLALAGGYLRFGKRELARLPLPDLPPGDARLQRLDALAVEMARADHLARPDLDAQIDGLVNALYGVGSG